MSDALVADRAARDALPTMFVGSGAVRDARTGSVRIDARRRSEDFLYGPYWRLAAGGWRLRVACRLSDAPHPALPCFGIEILANNRILCAARDVSPHDLTQGEATLFFVVEPELSAAETRAMFEFRFLQFGRAAVTIERVALEPHTRDDEDLQEQPRWRLLARARPGLASRQRGDGSLVSRWSLARADLISRLHPPLHLPSGCFRAELDCSVEGLRDPSEPVADLRFSAGGQTLLRREIRASSPGSEGRFQADFAMPADLAIESGRNLPVEVSVRQRANGVVSLLRLDATRLADRDMVSTPLPRIVGERRVVIVGNCQAEMLTQAWRQALTLGRFEPIYHFVRLNPRQLDQARRDIAACDLLLAQSIGDWEDYPLREEIPERVEVVSFPCLRFASPWPFDGFNGPSDPLALEIEGDAHLFENLDGRLARLRGEIPDRETRFSAYARLEPSDLRMIERLARYEEKRLGAMDREFSCDMGAYVLESFRSRRVFHATNHPDGDLFARLMRWVARRIGVRLLRISPHRLQQLGHIQVPIHPEVARALSIRWADERTLYEWRGRKVTWEQYVRAYIAHYG